VVIAPSGASLPVVETFHSLQGEGAHAGRSAFFIRLAGCSVGCPWCDTKHSWPALSHPQRPLAELLAEVQAAAAAGAGFVVITGGEPLEHDLEPLCDALAAAGLPKDVPLAIARSLEEWTGQKWQIEWQSEGGEPSLRETELARLATLEAQMRADPTVAALLAAFPEAELSPLKQTA
jgi:organic radical activating enzyme